MRPIILLLTLALAACAGRNNDPLEPLNRASLAVTYAVDVVALRPAAELYGVLPPPVRGGIRNALGNLRSPAILLSDVLQGETQRAAATAGRFLVNSTVGLGGLFDVAAEFGLPGHTEDFGQTLALLGVEEGPYLFLPILGPSNPRDLAGFAVDTLADPLTWIGGGGIRVAGRVRSGLTVLDARHALIPPLDAMMAAAPDPYITIRDVYRQRRAMELANRGRTPAAAPGTGFPVGMGMMPGEMR